MYKKIVILLLALLLCGCSASGTGINRPQSGQVSRASLILSDVDDDIVYLNGGEIFFLVDTELDEIYLEAAENFAQTIRSLTGGQVVITVQPSSGAENHFLAGRTQIAFLDGGKSQLESDYLAGFSMPFLYNDYESFTMAANKSETLRILQRDVSDTVGTVFLGGYYRPSKHLLTNWQAANYLSFPDTMLAVEEGSAAIPGFLSLEAMIREEAEVSRRLYLMLESDVQGGELTLEQMMMEDWTGQGMYLTYTYHSLQPLWLVIRSEYYNALTVQQQAAIREACARMFGDIDARLLEMEVEMEARLVEQGVLVNRQFGGARAEIHAALLDEEAVENEASQYVLELVRSLE